MKAKWIILITVVTILAGAYFYLHLRKSKDFEPQIKEQLANMVSTATNGLYQLDLQHIDIDITSGSVVASNIFLVPDSVQMAALEKSKQLGNDVFYVFIKKIDLKGLAPADLLDKKNIHLQSLVIDSPEIKIIHTKRVLVKNDTANLAEKITRDQQAYTIGKLLLNNIQLTITNMDKKGQVSAFENLSASFTDIQIDSATRRDSTRFLFARDAVMFMKGYHSSSKYSKYRFSIDSVALRPQDGSLTFFDLALKPQGTKDEFSAKLKFMDDRFDIHINKGEMKNINWFYLLAGEGFYGDELKMQGGEINVYDDRRLPLADTKLGRFPHQLLMKVGFPVNVPRVELNDFTISYEEYNPTANNSGKVEFNHVNGVIENLTNMPEQIAVNPVASIKANARLMNDGVLNASFRFKLNEVNTGAFEVDAWLGKMNGTNMNPTTEALALMKIKSLSIDQLEAHIKGSNYAAHGSVKFAYHDLAVDILKADDEGDTKKRGLFSLIAKAFVIKKSNPSNEDEKAETYNVSYTRDVRKSFFNLVWKLMMEGIKKSVKK
jgi:hypothetical protein